MYKENKYEHFKKELEESHATSRTIRTQRTFCRNVHVETVLNRSVGKLQKPSTKLHLHVYLFFTIMCAVYMYVSLPYTAHQRGHILTSDRDIICVPAYTVFCCKHNMHMIGQFTLYDGVRHLPSSCSNLAGGAMRSRA